MYRVGGGGGGRNRGPSEDIHYFPRWAKKRKKRAPGTWGNAGGVRWWRDSASRDWIRVAGEKERWRKRERESLKSCVQFTEALSSEIMLLRKGTRNDGWVDNGSGCAPAGPVAPWRFNRQTPDPIPHFSLWSDGRAARKWRVNCWLWRRRAGCLSSYHVLSVTGKARSHPSLPPIWRPILAEEMKGSASVSAAVWGSCSCFDRNCLLYWMSNSFV